MSSACILHAFVFFVIFHKNHDMPSLQIRKLPEKLYNALKHAAKNEKRSLTQQAIVTLARGLEDPVNAEHQRKIILEKLKSEKHLWKKWQDVDISKLIRNDRDSR